MSQPVSRARLAVRHLPLDGVPQRPMERLAARFAAAGSPNPWAAARRRVAALVPSVALVAAESDLPRRHREPSPPSRQELRSRSAG